MSDTPEPPKKPEVQIDLIRDCLGAPSGHVFPGMDNIPFRSNSPHAPNVKDDDPIAPTVVMDAMVKILDLSDDNDLKRYEFIWSKISEGRCQLSKEDLQYDPDTKNWRALLRYGVRWLEMKDKR